MNSIDTRSKLETLFRRLTDPATTDLEALDAFVWFRKMRLDAGDVSGALGTGASDAPNGPPMSLPASLVGAPKPEKDGPLWPFTKRHAGETIAHIARTDPDYLRYMLTKELREPLLGQIKAAMAAQEKGPK